MNIKELIIVSLFASITVVLSIFLIPLPFTPVPITLQIIAIALTGSILGPRLGLLSQSLYTLLGVIGLPVFAGGNAGFGVLLGPTGGYIFGFLAGVYVIGLITEKGSSYFAAFRQLLSANEKFVSYLHHLIAMSIGVFIIYLFGSLQLMAYTGLTFQQSIISGAAPFILPDFMKISVAAFIAVILKERLVKANLINHQGALH